MHSFFCFLATTCCLSCFAADGGFYRDFLTLADTNDLNPHLLKSPLLVDTNNTRLKLTNTVVQLEKLLGTGELASLRLGMTMDEVVELWGKPKAFYTTCGGGPRFLFADVDLVFRENALWRVRLPATVFDKSLTAQSSLRDWTSALVEPTRRVASTNSSFVLVYYESARCSVRLVFDPDGEQFGTALIELTATPVAPKR
jgi:hypothetical protein